MANELNRVEPPALPLAPEEYDRPYQDQSNNVLRLFFNRLVGMIREVISTDDGGKFLYFHVGCSTAQPIRLRRRLVLGILLSLKIRTLVMGSVLVANDSRITVSADGVYNFQVTLQTDHIGGSDATITTWINKNGTDVPYRGQQQTVKGNSIHAVFCNFSIDLTAGQYIEMYWATDDTNLSLDTQTATSPHPGIPSAIVAVSFVSNL
jgi:hypothetical protein